MKEFHNLNHNGQSAEASYRKKFRQKQQRTFYRKFEFARVIEIIINSGGGSVGFKLLMQPGERYLKIQVLKPGDSCSQEIIHLKTGKSRYSVSIDGLEPGTLPLEISCYSAQGKCTRNLQRRPFLV